MILGKIRENIDLIDHKLLRLLKDRMEWALMAKRFKAQIEDGERERKILKSVRTDSTGLLRAGFTENTILPNARYRNGRHAPK